MKEFLNHKIAATIGICLFIGISAVVINAHDMQTISRVKFSNRSIIINQKNPELSNTDLDFGKSSDKNIKISNSDSDLNNKETGINNHDIKLNNNGKLNTSNSNGINPKNENVNFSNQNFRTESERYAYQNIDWSTWKSNFVNKILDDSLYLSCLDNYGVGTWFYYSFVVTDTGLIRDVNVFSLYLSDEDKKAVRKLIRSYAHKPITVFPKNSKRKMAKVKAIMLLGDTESKSNASNFKDIEKVKIKY